MQSKWWLCLCTAVILALSGAAVADEHGHGHGKHHNRDDDRDGRAAITTEMRFVGGTTITAIICRQGLPRETGCRRDWKGSYGCAERCPRDCVRKWWRARWNSKGVCLHLRQAMETLLSAGTSFW